jgi:DNA polymerase-3 subunit alpha
VVSYQTAYLKANYPVEFMAAVMSAESGNEDKIYAAVEECKAMGLEILPPDVNESLDDFTVVDEKTIRFGLNAIKNLGSDVIAKIIEERAKNGQFKNLLDFLTRVYIKNLNKKSWEALAKTGALDRFGERGQLLENTEYVLDSLREHFKVSNQDSLFGNSALNLKLKDASPASKEDRLTWEKELLGLYVSAHPLDSYQKVLSSFTKIRQLKSSEVTGSVVVGGLITKLKKTITKKNETMAFATLEDGTGSIEVIIFPKSMQTMGQFLEIDRVLQIKGKVSSGDGKTTPDFFEGEEAPALDVKIIVDEITDLPNDELYTLALQEMQKNQQIVIHLSNTKDTEVLEKIKDVVIKTPGNAQVYLSLGSGPAAKKIKTQTQVQITNELLSALKAIPEINMISES